MLFYDGKRCLKSDFDVSKCPTSESLRWNAPEYRILRQLSVGSSVGRVSFVQSRQTFFAWNEAPVLAAIFGLLFIGIVVVLWAGSIYLQGWLYNAVASKMPLRAVVGGLVVSGFLTGWCFIYTADPGRFDTLINFSREKTDGVYHEIESIRKVGKDEKKPVKYVRSPGGRGATTEFLTTDGQKQWTRSDSEGMVVAILVKEKDKAEPTRFEAKLDAGGKFPVSGLRYLQPNSSRYMDEASLGTIYRVRSWSLLGNLGANFLHLAVWCLVLCFVMRFEFGNAVGLGLGLWGVTMLAVQPAIFGLITK